MRSLLIAFLFATLAAVAEASPREEVIQVPVTVEDMYGKVISHAITVTVFDDDANAQPAPVLVLNHGRSPDAAVRAQIGRARYGGAAHFFVQQGFIVAVPTRIGYGVTGGEDVEYSGSCGRRLYRAGYDAAAVQTLAVLDAVRQRPQAARDRAVIVGQSYGGLTSLAVAARNPPGVQVTINIAGGGGGNPATHAQQPCSPVALERLFAQYGREAKVPTLWIYTENDQYFGPAYPRQWHAAYTAAGGAAEFTQFPPHGDDGHLLFTRFPQAWQPRVLQFLRAHGFERR